jgi:molybdopterin-dependent oxidoreductase alpha subunit
MTHTAQSGPAAIPEGVDTLTLIAEGFFPTHAPRGPGPAATPALHEAVKRACDATAVGHDAALLAQPPIEKRPATIRHPSRSAAGLPAIAESFRVAFEKLGPLDTMRLFTTVNQKTGFDCQSCAWPSPDGKRHKFEFCENGAKAMANAGARHTIGREFFRQWTIDALAAQSDQWLNARGRLIEPLWRREGAAHYEPISWDDAFGLLGRTLGALDSPDRAAFYTSGRASNEAAFIYQLFARQFGTNNLPDCSNMCHESSGTALVESLGIGKGTVTLEDFEQADMIILIGQNPATNHPRMLTSLEHAKKHGATIIVINPLREPGLFRFTDPNPDEYSNPLSFALHIVGSGRPLGDLHLPVRVNGDIAVIKGLMKVVLDEEAKTGNVLDRQFIHDQTDGFEALVADLDATSWQAIVDGSGIPRETIEQAGRMIARAKRMICCWAMGLTQHKDAVAGIQVLVNLLLLGGHIGRPGAGTCCVRGHSNVQGDRTMGIWERPTAPFLDALSHEFAFEPPRHAGHDSVDTIAAMHNGEVEVFFGLGGNFLAATPDTACTADALRRCRLTAHVATNLNRGHLITGREALLLPCFDRSERDPAGLVTVEDAFGVVSSSRGPLEPASDDLMSEIGIVARMAKATLGERTTVDWDGLAANYDRIRDHISRVVPGTQDFNARIAKGPFYLPNPARNRRFVTSTGRAHFIVAPISVHDLDADQFLLTTIRSHDQFNTTVYGLTDRYRGVHGGRRVLFMNRDDLAERGWAAGDRVDITSHFHDERRVARSFQLVPFAIAQRCVAAYFPEANVLVPMGSVAERSNTPTSKSIHVTLARSA